MHLLIPIGWKFKEINIFNFIEEKILAIEEIRREESKSKMLLAEAMAAGIIFILSFYIIFITVISSFQWWKLFIASMEDENHGGKNLSERSRYTRERRREGINISRKNMIRSAMDRKYSERYKMQ